MIPKVIHYCWFSNERKPVLIQHCIKSWKRIMPDYQIKCWDHNSFDFDSVPFVKEAIERRKWAFAADYVRLYALYTEGGIYLDSDVEVFKRFDCFINNDFFAGTEIRTPDGKTFTIEAGIMGAKAGHLYLKQCMDYYQNRHFILPNGEIDQTVLPDICANILSSYGYKYQDITATFAFPLSSTTEQHSVTIYNSDVFANKYKLDKNGKRNNLNYYARHHNTSYWMYTNRGKLFHFCKNWNIEPLYQIIEYITHNIKKIFKQK